MRADMFKVIVERPRRGAGHAPSVKLKKDKDPHKQIGLKRHARQQAAYTKGLKENLAPLVRFPSGAWGGAGTMCSARSAGSSIPAAR